MAILMKNSFLNETKIAKIEVIFRKKIKAISLLNTSCLTNSYTHSFYPQKGICVQKHNFWPKNDGEKWSRENYFEIPPCRKMVIFVTEFVILGIS